MRDQSPAVLEKFHESTSPPAYAAQRWILAVTSVAFSRTDVKDFRAWSRIVGASRGTLRQWCRMAGPCGKASLDFARVLRAVLLSRRYGWHPEDLIDIIDDRTLASLMGRAGLTGLASGPPTLQHFMDRQRLITDQRLLTLLRQNLNASIDSPEVDAPPVAPINQR